MYHVLVAGLILALTTAIATDMVQIPAFASSPFATVILVIASLGSFTAAPMVGLSLFLMTAVLFFKRNVAFTVSNSMYGAKAIPMRPMGPAIPYTTTSSEPRDYSQFQETALGRVEGFEPAPYGDEAGAPVDGQYPKEEERPQGEPVALDYVYRPAEDTGSNEFQRYGPDMDEKKDSFKYTDY